jgi:hypothetical protein
MGRRIAESNFLSAAEIPAAAYAEQVIALNGVTPGAKFHMTAFMGKNYGNQNPKDVKLTATFQDDRGQTIQETTIHGPDTAVDYGIPGGLQPRSDLRLSAAQRDPGEGDY